VIFYFNNAVTKDLNIFSFQSFDELKNLVSKYGEVKLVDPGKDKNFLVIVSEVVEKQSDTT